MLLKFRFLTSKILLFALILGLIWPAFGTAQTLQIRDLDVEILGTDVQISWRTSFPASGCVEFGPSTSSTGSRQASSIQFGGQAGQANIGETQRCATVGPDDDHVIRLVNLAEKTKYRFRVVSEDIFGNRTVSFEQTFKTGERGDAQAPELDNLDLPYVGGSIVVITWQTDEKAKSRVDFGVARSSQPDVADLTKSKGSSSLRVEHELKLTGLSTGTTYRYRVSSEDKDGNTVMSSIQSFKTFNSKTIDGLPLTISNVRPISSSDAGIGETHVTVSWHTSRAADSLVRYGAKPTSLRSRLHIKAPNVVQHAVTLEDLDPGTTYYFRVESRDILGKKAKSPDDDGIYSFVTRGQKPAQTSQVRGASASSGRTKLAFSKSAQPSVIIGLRPQTRVLGAFTYIYTPANALLKDVNSGRIYALFDKQKHLIKDTLIFQSYGYRFSDVSEARAGQLKAPNIRLAKEPGKADVYYIDEPRNLKLAIPSEDVFNSYQANHWIDVATLSPTDLASYDNVNLVRVGGNPTVYALENGLKRPIASIEAFTRFGFDWGKIVTINKTHWEALELGPPIE